jgi:hypothetical protein
MTNRLRLLAKDKDHPDSIIEIEVEADTPDAVQTMVKSNHIPKANSVDTNTVIILTPFSFFVLFDILDRFIY